MYYASTPKIRAGINRLQVNYYCIVYSCCMRRVSPRAHVRYLVSILIRKNSPSESALSYQPTDEQKLLVRSAHRFEPFVQSQALNRRTEFRVLKKKKVRNIVRVFICISAKYSSYCRRETFEFVFRPRRVRANSVLFLSIFENRQFRNNSGNTTVRTIRILRSLSSTSGQ